MPKTSYHVVFDLGGVLFDWNPEKILSRRYPDRADRELLHQAIFRHQDWLDFDRGTLIERTAVERFSERTGFSRAAMETLMQDVRESLTPLEDTWALLQELRREGIPIYCLSNIASSTFDYLQACYPRWHLFDGIVISGTIGLMKPEREIYDHLIDRFALEPSRTLFIDDMEPNVAGAKRAGWHALRFIDIEQCRRELALLAAPTLRSGVWPDRNPD